METITELITLYDKIEVELALKVVMLPAIDMEI